MHHVCMFLSSKFHTCLMLCNFDRMWCGWKRRALHVTVCWSHDAALCLWISLAFMLWLEFPSVNLQWKDFVLRCSEAQRATFTHSVFTAWTTCHTPSRWHAKTQSLCEQATSCYSIYGCTSIKKKLHEKVDVGRIVNTRKSNPVA